ncbi:hypothetical protein PtrSN002B_007705 [Pyrenophora tritici-repentis]|nr:hypothetical protein PtrV1_06229 [Pyrenophora tritici-repentis]KAG9380836.1 hypothetical protein A1F94_008156 [Pyrenophora tritici-repentis]KAI1531750.1 hypothetical protein PtrSN001A_007578 [Pyrenophora tritici-repentis]KAI1532804.1 hypothetical protein PtrSN001C_007835 [Pyrenophora tritici-repentis]KAI1543891.1 hypothetical protein PtrSN002B_007705 [Pyrenophora tritici-repentis]
MSADTVGKVGKPHDPATYFAAYFDHDHWLTSILVDYYLQGTFGVVLKVLKSRRPPISVAQLL